MYVFRFILMALISLSLMGCSVNSGEIIEIIKHEYPRLDIIQEDMVEKSLIVEKIVIPNGEIYIYEKEFSYHLGILFQDKEFYLGELSMENTPEGLMGFEEIGNVIKAHGILGANYSKSFYLFLGDDMVVYSIDGNTSEELEENQLIVYSQTGTIPQLKIYYLCYKNSFFGDINTQLELDASYMEEGKIISINKEGNEEKFIHDGGALKRVK